MIKWDLFQVCKSNLTFENQCNLLYSEAKKKLLSHTNKQKYTDKVKNMNDKRQHSEK